MLFSTLFIIFIRDCDSDNQCDGVSAMAEDGEQMVELKKETLSLNKLRKKELWEEQPQTTVTAGADDCWVIFHSR